MTKDRLNLLLILALCLVTSAIYAQAAFFPFHSLDDPYVILGNTHLGFSLESLKWAFTSSFTGNWQPVTWLSFMIDHALFAKQPMGYHVVNVIFHVIDTALLYLLLRHLTGAAWRSAAVAALFALHPLHVESVAWITERKDVLSAFFWMGTLLCYAAYVKQAKNKWLYLSLASFSLGIMAKPMLVTLPVVLLLLDYWPLQRFNLFPFARCSAGAPGERYRVLLEKIPFFCISLLSSAIALLAQDSQSAASSLDTFTLYERLSNALLSYARYLEKMLVPSGLAVYYPMRPVALWETVGAALLIVAMIAFSLRTIKKYPYVAVGTFWYLVTLLPVIGLVQVGAQSMADRYSYLPLIGLFTVASWGAADLAAKWPKLRTLICSAAGVAIAGCAVLTAVQLGYWKDNIRLFSHATSVTQTNFMAHYHLGVAYAAIKRNDLALQEFQSYLEIIRDDHQAYTLVAKLLDQMGRGDEAAANYFKALELKPDEPEYLNSVGGVFLQQNKLDEAIWHFSEALRLNPQFKQAASNLQFAQGRKSRAPQK